MMLNDFLEKVALICFRHNCSVSSWIRTPKRNASVGGSANSQHLLGTAVDIVPDDWHDLDDIIWDCNRLGIIPVVEKDKGHIHLQLLKAKP